MGVAPPNFGAAFAPLFFPGDTVSRNGTYRIANLASGQYEVAFTGGCGFGVNWAQQWFRGQPAPATADIVNVTAGRTTAGINAVLRPAGAISGTIRTPHGRPLADECVSATNLRTGASLGTLAGGSGVVYQIGNLAPGTYAVEFFSCVLGENYATQWYKGSTKPQAAVPVTVTGGHVTRGISAALETGGTISGRVTAKATGQPVRNVCVFTTSPSVPSLGVTNRAGEYRITGLNTGSYRLVFVSCNPGGPNLAGQVRQGIVHVTLGRPVTGVDAALGPGAAISGTVSGGEPAVAQPGICIDAVPVARHVVGEFATAGRGGHYTVRHLAPGRYKVFFGDPQCFTSPPGLAPQWFDHQPREGTASIVTTKAGHTTAGIDATLAPDGVISGTVTGPAPAHTRLTGVCVRAVPLAAGADPIYARTSEGSYLVAGVLPGRYLVQFQSGCGLAGYAAQWWRHASSESTATVIKVAADAATTGINASLQRASG